jgi:hypothetical protein
MDYRQTYLSAAESFCDLVSRLPAESWDEVGLGATGQLLSREGLDLVRNLADQASQALAVAGDDDVVVTAVGGMRVRDWMPTRTFELVVHGLDAARAANVPIEFSPASVTEALEVAAAMGDGALVLRALSGRAVLPTGFSVV